MPKNKKLSDSEASSDEDLKKKPKKTSKKRKASTSDSDSGPEDRGPAKKPAPVANKKSSAAASSTGEASWCLEGMRFVKVDEFRGRPLVSIREYYEKNGQVLPGKKGISLSATQWRKLVDLVDNVNAELDKY